MRVSRTELYENFDALGPIDSLSFNYDHEST